MVSFARRIFHQRRVGHAGTLDPLAEGVLPLLLGRATRLADFLADGHKVYYAEVLLGFVTSTDDLEGETVAQSAVPDYTDQDIRMVLDQFVGETSQVPPSYSAIKLSGETSYKRARRGDAIAIPARTIRIDGIYLVSRTDDRIALVVRCGKGTYIRALARDIGERLGCGATLARLIRMQVGELDLARSVTPTELEAATESDALEEHVLPPDQACSRLAAIVLDGDTRRRAVNGQGWRAEHGAPTIVRAYSPEGVFIGLARRELDRDGVDDQSWWRLKVMVNDV